MHYATPEQIIEEVDE